MIIRVKIFAYLRYYLTAPNELTQNEEWDVPEETTIAQVLEKLNLPREIRIVVLLNGRTADGATTLNEGDIVHILPQIAGG